MNDWDRLFERIETLASASGGSREKLKAICELLVQNVSHYDWAGFYFADESRRELILGPFAGEKTEHCRIRYGRGVCGRAAESKKTLLVQDVSREENYLSCSDRVKSEIVVPVLKNGEFSGELDIDSHTVSPFGEEDKRFLERVAEIIAGIL